jgi:uncharacterized NAD(P)/FAD-binding protein YdhS
MTSQSQSIAIVGGGFSGTITAVHLLRRPPANVHRIIIVDRSGAMARGVAYGTDSDHHVLNVVAGQMSAFDADPHGFVRFVRARGLDVDDGAFVPRGFYGAYLESLLAEAAEQADGVTLERVNAEVLRIEPAPTGDRALLTLSSGAEIHAARVVLAVGNYPPETSHFAADGFPSDSRRYISDPWARGALETVERGAPVVLMGTGLTMVDVVMELRALGAGECLAISRRGLLPLSHRTTQRLPDRSEFPPALVDGDGEAASVRAYVRAVRRHIRDAASRDVDWRDVIASLRPSTPRLWQALSPDERRRFLRHVKPFWDVHRHRMAPQLHEAFAALQRGGQVTVLAGRVVGLFEEADGAVVQFRPRGAADTRALKAGAVVNCTGPVSDTRRIRESLFADLCERGLLRPDALGLGIETTSTGALIDADGRPSSILFYVGPFTRARDWEATAVPELRRHARDLADQLTASLNGA